MMAKVAVIIPVRNEELNILKVIVDIQQHVMETKPQVIVIDDNCTDQTIAKLGVAELNNIGVGVLVGCTVGEHGFGYAIRKGFDMIRKLDFEYVVVVMGDCSDRVRDIDRMVKFMELHSNIGVVAPSRYMHGGKIIGKPFWQRLSSHSMCYLARIIFKVPLTDLTNAFKCYRMAAIKDLELKSTGFDITPEITLKVLSKGWRAAEFPTVWSKREHGHSKFRLLSQAKSYLYWLLWYSSTRLA